MDKKLNEIEEITNFAEISHNYDALICDVWGVLHNGQKLFDGVEECLKRFKKENKIIILLSNAPRPSLYVKKMLDNLNFNEECYDKIITSGDLTKKSLNSNIFGRNCYHIGPDRDLNIFDDVEVSRVEFEAADFIFVTGLFDDENEDENDYLELLLLAKERGMKLICANPDLLVQRGNKLIPCAGSISKKYYDMGGESINIGKPYSPIFEEAISSINRLNNLVDNKIMVIGDGLDTDIKGANIVGLDSLLVLGGLFSNNSRDKILESIENKGIYPNYYINELIW